MVFSEAIANFLIVYLDDILVYLNTEDHYEEHLT